MRALPILVILVLPLQSPAQKKPAPQAPAPFVKVARGDLARAFPLSGRFVPAGPKTLSLWFKAYQGDLVLTWVLPQGSAVTKGSLLARIDPKGIDKEMESLQRQIEAQELALDKAVQEDRIAAESEKKQVEAASRELDRARTAFRMWEKVELPLTHRSEDLQAQRMADNIQDQKDELEQLEKMYRQDELVDATEEIVLERARRNLSRSLEAQAVQRARLKHKRDYAEPLERAKKKENIEALSRKLAHLKVQLKLAARTRKAEIEKLRRGIAKSKARLQDLKKDRKLFDLRSPRAGILLYGSPAAYRPGGAPPRYKRGSRLSARTVLFTIASAERVDLALDVPEAKIPELKERTAVEVRALAAPSKAYMGAMRVDRFPAASPGGSQVFHALVEIEGKTPGLLPGMRAKAKVLLKPLKGVLLIPEKALMGSQGHWFCYAEKAGTGEFAKTPVVTGPRSGGMVVIRRGLAAGQKVLLGGGAK